MLTLFVTLSLELIQVKEINVDIFFLQAIARNFWNLNHLDHFYTVNFGSEMGQAKHVSGKNTFCSMNREKIREERIFEIVHFPFEGRAKLHHLLQPNGLVGRCQLGGNSKGQCMISKILFPLLFYTFIEQNIFFPETCFAYPIFEHKFIENPSTPRILAQK